MIGLRGIPASAGGVEAAVEGLSVGLVERGHEVTVYARRGYSNDSLDEYRGVRLIHLGTIDTKHLEAISHTTFALADALRSRRYDVIHLHATGPALLSIAPRLIGVPTVSTVQGLDWRREKWGRFATSVLKAAARVSVTVPNATIAVSKGLQLSMEETYGKTPNYIPNGVSVQPRYEQIPVEPLTSDRFVLYLGRLVPEKHVHTLIGAYRRIQTDIPLVIAGPDTHTGSYVEDLRTLAKADPRVLLIGPRYDGEKEWLLSNASLFVQPSSIEGLPVALLEALSRRRFPVVSQIPENLEPITTEQGVLGESFPVGDERQLAECIERGLSRADRGAVGVTLQTHVEQTYAWPKIVAETEEVYRRVLAQSRRSSFG
jgi:glycosyltransferase involved in cell wall biosynthesis